ncbi:hypothetical protein [Thioclava electrotropha]|uniref:Uncharacterized protein n=1 Tax=Thioclava electrotropha TaxID=1549850 RepID=A0ABX6YW42_9RHOB|nr:hypothetical protein [Thioclava electrotropha]QPZ91697.1 hypothetical protein AKL02_012875 [Thioclava electrotropha]
MKYIIRDELVRTSTEISESRFEEVKNAASRINLIWDVEENFDLFARAFVELEKYQMTAALQYYYSARDPEGVDELFEETRPQLNLKLVALLTASRAYEEQLHQRASCLRKLTENSEIEFKGAFSNAFDASFEYRVMYNLRNHAQHQRPPLGRLSFSHSSQWKSEPRHESPARSRISINPKLNTEELINSKRFNQKVRDEINGLNLKHLDLKFFTRGFIQEIYKIHQHFRRTTENDLQKFLGILKVENERLSILAGQSCDYPVLEKIDENGNRERTLIDYAHQARILAKRKHWTGLEWVQGGFISSEISYSNDTFPRSHEKIWVAK